MIDRLDIFRSIFGITELSDPKFYKSVDKGFVRSEVISQVN